MKWISYEKLYLYNCVQNRNITLVVSLTLLTSYSLGRGENGVHGKQAPIPGWPLIWVNFKSAFCLCDLLQVTLLTCAVRTADGPEGGAIWSQQSQEGRRQSSCNHSQDRHSLRAPVSSCPLPHQGCRQTVLLVLFRFCFSEHGSKAALRTVSTECTRRPFYNRESDWIEIASKPEIDRPRVVPATGSDPSPPHAVMGSRTL